MENKNIQGTIDCKFLEGRLLKNSGKYYESKYKYEEALSLSQQIKDSNRIGSGYNNLGNLYVMMHEYKLAYENLQNSIYCFKEVGDFKKMAYPLSNIGKIYLDTKVFDSAIYYYNQTVEISTRYNDYYELAQTFKRIASIYSELDNYSLAFQYCDTTLALSEKYRYRYIIADVYEIQAKIYLKMKDYKKSKLKLESCLALYNQLQVKPSIEYCYKQLSILDTLEGNYKNAYRHYKLYHLYHDSLIDLENRVNFEKHRLNTQSEIIQYEALRKRNILYIIIAFICIISILIFLLFKQQQITKRKIAVAQTKNKISQDLHDEIGSSLSSISMQTEVLKKRIKNNENIDELIDVIKIESRKTMSIMNDIVWSLNTENDNFPQFLNRLKNYCSVKIATLGLHYEINVEKDIQVYRSDLYLFKEIFLIAKEFINNSLKYAECQHIRIDIFRNNDRIYFHIQDDGKGFDFEKIPTGLGGTGIKSIHNRARLANVAIQFKSIINVGTYLHLSWNDSN